MTTRELAVNFGEVIEDIDVIREKSLVINAYCPRCGGSLFQHRDRQCTYYCCEFGCSREFDEDLKEREPQIARKKERVRW